MKYLYILVPILTLIIISCSGVKDAAVSKTIYTDYSAGFLIVTNSACFFIPEDSCKYISHDESDDKIIKGLIISEDFGEEELSAFHPIVTQIQLLPNEDSDIIGTLDWYHRGYLNPKECCVLFAKVKLTSFYRNVDILSFAYKLKFNMNGSNYEYNCLYFGTDMHCEIISLEDDQRAEFIATGRLPIGEMLE